jgi:hypothetical protein
MSTSDIGTAVAIATGAPATQNKAGFEALTWVVINGIQEAPTFGTTHADIDVPDLSTGFTTGLKGAETGVADSLMFREIAADAGQVAVLAAARARAEYSLRTISPDGTVYTYCSGLVKDYVPNKPTTTSYAGASVTFRPNAVPVVTTAPS